MYNKRTYYLKLVILIFNFIPAIFSRITSMNDLLLLCDYWLRYFWKSLKTQESVSAHYNGLNVTITRQGAKSRYKWYLLRLILNIIDSRIKSRVFTVYIYVNEKSNKFFRVAFADDTNVASKCKTLNTLADTINKEVEEITCWYMRKLMQFYFQIL